MSYCAVSCHFHVISSYCSNTFFDGSFTFDYLGDVFICFAYVYDNECRILRFVSLSLGLGLVQLNYKKN